MTINYSATPPAFPISRPRRLRLTPMLRDMVRETIMTSKDFIYPLFIRHGQGIKEEIRSMPGQFQWSVDQLAAEAKSIAELGIPAVILFGIPSEKDPIGLENYAPDGIIQQAIRAIKAAVPELVVITDVCLCEYTDHGHCGVLNAGAERTSSCPRAMFTTTPRWRFWGRSLFPTLRLEPTSSLPAA